MLRVMTIVNLSLWSVLFVAWIPYTIAVGSADPVSVQVRTILVVTILLMMLLGIVRLRRRRPVLG
ncbi:MAG: hypothetical protein AUH80_01980 [Chloroflexi bacterium 13_1_40CM_4_65_16]|nr:MAG: hypothetical protein AUH27_07350 [Chloroflexi bacterium 13_1_40CM_66_19]OLC49033.1 MAG: hypothetical protein AUH80_01980 [Chloroflexi bacterium 13_1_40CM_4_65_16]OLD53366.1 MAG: hypothetical protein AUI56_04290 [Actinobacteria bacterium 13_1_40CM_2_66_13]OLE72072.1 MAG: hypothetical protein AUG05_06650 [Actinobacteria bacterium 13_1_20CM_2_66_18]